VKKAITAFLVITLVFLTACYEQPVVKSESAIASSDIKRVGMVIGDQLGYSTLEQMLEPAFWGSSILEDYSVDLIVIGEFIEETKTGFKYAYNEFFDKDVVVDAYAIGKFRIIRVLKGDRKKGDVIVISKRYSFDEEDGHFVSFGGLTPMHKGDRWIYCLHGTGSDVYYSAGDTDGRYPLPNKEIMELMSLFTKDVIDASKNDNWDLYDEARRKVYGHEKFNLATFGVYERNNINFLVYAELLKHFKIKQQNWVNPNMDVDMKIIAAYEKTILTPYD